VTADPALDDKRVAIVNEHMRLENAYDFPGCVGVFGKPKYQLIADGELYDGADRVRYFLSQNHTAFPDFVFEPTRVSPTTDAVLVEGRFTGTHLGSWRGTSSSTASTSSSPRCRCPGSATTCCCGGSSPTATWTSARAGCCRGSTTRPPSRRPGRGRST
jgi:hypothetical protein